MPRPILVFTAVLVTLLIVAPPAHASWTWPLRGEVITNYRNGDDPYAAGQHRGIDIAGEVGEPVVAAAGGEVRFAGTVGTSGLTVSVRTADGFDTSYLHLSATSVRAGERVLAGERLGAVGTTGTRSATEPHLHFGVREAGSEHAYRDPLDFLPPPLAAPRQAPDPTHAPSPEPVPPAPAPEPAPAPGDRRVPAGGRVPAPAARPRPDGRRLPRGAPTPRRAPVPHGTPVPHRAPVPHMAPGPQKAPVPHPGKAPRGRRPIRGRPWPTAAHSVSAHRMRRPTGFRRGLGTVRRQAGVRRPRLQYRARARSRMLIACAGLLLAAALVGGTDDGRTAVRSAGGRAARLLRPILSRG